MKDSEDTLDLDNLKKAVDKLKEVSMEAEEQRLKRTIKNYKGLYMCLKRIDNDKNLSDSEKIGLSDLLGKLTNGHFLLMNKTEYKESKKMLKKYDYPKEILENIHKTEYLPD